MLLTLFLCDSCRSEIHEKMNCNRCQNYDERPESVREEDGFESKNEGCQSYQMDCDDIGGFAGITGCLHKLKRSEKQVCQNLIWCTSIIFLSRHLIWSITSLRLISGGDSFGRGFRKLGASFFLNISAWRYLSSFSGWWGGSTVKKVLYLIRIFSWGLLIYKVCQDLISVWVPLDCKYRAANAKNHVKHLLILN